MNKVFFIGNLTKDAELEKVGDDISVCRFNIAVNRPYRKDKEQEVDFFRIITWRGQADYCAEHLKKGNKIAVLGRLEINNYEDKNGDKRVSVDVQAIEVEKLNGFEKKNDDEVASSYDKRNDIEMKPITDDSLPF